jgi:asparagine synthase (glutamine-hydrolysing)
MCGISGWISWKDDLKESRHTLTIEAMGQAMVLRGPNEGGTYRSTHAALAHRRLSIIDIEGGQQPMAVNGPSGEVAVISYNGEVYNFAEIRDELIALGHRFNTRSDTEVVLRAYQQWGIDSASHLNGIYAYAIWDERAQLLILVRDRLAVKPLYYYPYADGVLFSSEPKGILANPIFKARIDESGIIELLALASAPTPGHGIYRDMHQVKGGYVVTISKNGIEEHRYWKLEPQHDVLDYKNTIHEIRELLEDIVSRQLVADVNIGTLLSGGLDSSVISALAAKHMRNGGDSQLKTYSVDFKEHAKYFKQTPWHTSRDEPFAREVAKYIDSQHTTIIVDPDTQSAHEQTALIARDLPGWGEMDVSLYLLFKEVAKFSTVVLSGESSDEIFGGYPFLRDVNLHSTHTFPWLEGKTLFASLLRSDVIGQKRVQEYVYNQYDNAIADVGDLPGETVADTAARRAEYVTLTRWLPALLDRNDRMSMAAGLEVRVPFCDHRLVELLYNTSSQKKYVTGIEKTLLRNAVGDILPQSVLQRTKSGFPARLDPQYEESLQRRTADLINNPNAQIWDLIDLGKLKTQLATKVPLPGPRAAPSTTNGLGYLLSIDSWLRLYKPEFTL